MLAAVLAACAEFPQRPRGGGEPPGGHHVVSRGDTLYSIAWRHDLDYRTVARWNDIQPPYTIYPGDRIRLSPPTDPVPTPIRKRQENRSGQPERGSGPDQSRQPQVSDRRLSWQWPAAGEVKRPYSASASGKRGVELGGRAGQPVRAAAAGRVVYSGDGLRGYGNLVIIKHNQRYLTAYGYNRRLLVAEGERVSAGQRIALMGLGPDDTPGLHFELRRDGKPIDPGSVLPPR